MASSRRRELDTIPESPVKRRKLVNGKSQTSQKEYNSDEDSGDDLLEEFETEPTLIIDRRMPSQTQTQLRSSQEPYVTQPTQIIGKETQAKQRTEKNENTQAVVQVEASSPVQPPEKRPTAWKPAPRRGGGILASAMAPAGTAFRLPYGVQRSPVKKAEVIDISDDDAGPRYRGASSDSEEDARRANITPTTFTTSKSSGAGGPKTGNTNKGPAISGVERFKEIAARSFYKPANSSTSASSKRKQVGPSRAQPVQDISLDDVDFDMRQKIRNMQAVIPSASVLLCKTALIHHKGNYDNALDAIVERYDSERAIDLTASGEDDISPQKPTSAPPKLAAKRQLVSNRTIQEKYSSTQARAPQPATPKKPKRKLVQGRKHPSSPDLPTPEPQKPVSHKRAASDYDDSDSAVQTGDEDGKEVELEAKVLKFLNTCPIRDLSDIASVTEEVAQVILSQRGSGFRNLDEVREISSSAPSYTKSGKPRNQKPIGDKIVETCLDMWTGYEAVDSLVAKCEALGKPVAAEMKRWGFDVFGGSTNGELSIASLDVKPKSESKASTRDSGIGTPSSSPSSPGNDAEDGIKGAASRVKDGIFIGQPACMSDDITLKDYQLVGLNWLSLLYRENLSCILADEMGLGKTCQVIAFLAHLLERGINGPHLIIVPGSTLENWLREFKTFCPALVVEPYYGLQDERMEMRERIENMKGEINVIVTTYNIAQTKIDNKFLRRLRPNVCVFDEAHFLKNAQSQRYEQLMRIPTPFRLLLTGTPLQNNLKELAALLSFVLPNLFRQRKDDLDYIFKHKAKTTDEDHSALLSAQRIARAKSMMTPFVLRRRKHQVLKDLPKKTNRVEYCELTDSQRALYNAELETIRAIAATRARGEKPDEAITNRLMRLRKAAIHPLLFRRLYTDATIKRMSIECIAEEKLWDADPDLVFEDMEVMSDFELHTLCGLHTRTLSPYRLTGGEWMDSGKVQALVRLLKEFKSNGDRALVFSQFTIVLDVLEAVLESASISYCRLDGQTKIDQRQTLLDLFHKDTSISCFLLSTGAGGAGINLAAANKVVIFDSSFNPQEDVQAENRAHRVGQVRPVEVVRLVTRGTVEEAIWRLGQGKLRLDDMVAGVDKKVEKDVLETLLAGEEAEAKEEEGKGGRDGDEEKEDLGKERKRKRSVKEEEEEEEAEA